MPKKSNSQKGKKVIQAVLSDADHMRNIIQQVFQSKFNGTTIDYIQGVFEGVIENINEDLQNEQMVFEALQDILEDKQLNEKQIRDYSKQIVEKFCMAKNIAIIQPQQDEEEEKEDQKKLSNEEIFLMKKQKEEENNKYKAKFKDIIDEVDEDMVWDQKTIQEFEEMKIQQEKAMKYGCVLCERIIPLTFHHLIPRTTHSRPYNRGKSNQKLNVGIWICRQCHSGIHRLIDEETMAQEYYSYDLLLEHEGVIKMAKYMNKQKISSKQDRRVQYGDKYLRENKSERL